MQIIETIAEMKEQAAAWRAAGKRVALVPTMGALHAGQEALIREAVPQADVVVVSSVINPLRFAVNELVGDYPRSPEANQALCQSAGASVLFTPDQSEIYPQGFSTYVSEERLSKPLCGISRPTHFRGVTTLTAKLINIVQPQLLVFGQKTAQRVAVVRKMIADLAFDIEVLVVPTVREEDGLACDTNTRDFTAKQREEASAVSRSLRKVEEMVAGGVRNPDRLVAEVTHILAEYRQVRVIYVSLVNRETMEPVREVEPGKCLLAISVWINEIRLIDNTLL
jgi:pantoate--beta-alanine ligase